jgi:hypothetical protein
MTSLHSRFKLVLRIGLVCALILTAACGGSLYKVKPVVQAPIADGASGAEAGGIKVHAVPILIDEEIQELFEANLLLAGLLPVRADVTNESGAPVDLKNARFHLRDGDGREWKAKTAKQAVAGILKYYDVYLYNPNSRRKFEEDFRMHALNIDAPLAQGEQRSGLVFFQTPKKEAVSSPRGLVLTIEKLPQTIELKLN